MQEQRGSRGNSAFQSHITQFFNPIGLNQNPAVDTDLPDLSPRFRNDEGWNENYHSAFDDTLNDISPLYHTPKENELTGIDSNNRACRANTRANKGPQAGRTTLGNLTNLRDPNIPSPNTPVNNYIADTNTTYNSPIYTDAPYVPRKVQLTLDGRIAGGDNDAFYGDLFQKVKPSQVLRIVSQNLNQLPAYAHFDKSKRLIRDTKAFQVDILCCSEVGLYLPNLEGLTPGPPELRSNSTRPNQFLPTTPIKPRPNSISREEL